jgi:hypothetical protein
MKALKVTSDGSIELITLRSDRLRSFYEHIGCRTVTAIEPTDIAVLHKRFPSQMITGWGDDEGLFVAEPEMNMTTMVLFGYPPSSPLVGTWIITGHDEEGDTTQLSDDVLALAGVDIIDLIDFAPGRTDG